MVQARLEAERRAADERFRVWMLMPRPATKIIGQGEVKVRTGAACMGDELPKHSIRSVTRRNLEERFALERWAWGFAGGFGKKFIFLSWFDEEIAFSGFFVEKFILLGCFW